MHRVAYHMELISLTWLLDSCYDMASISDRPRQLLCQLLCQLLQDETWSKP